MKSEQYRSLYNLPSLAGLCSMQAAVQADWSVEESAERLKRIHYVLKQLVEALIARITSEPIYELKTLFSHHAYILSEQVTLIRNRVSEMREPPLGLDKVPHPALQLLVDEIAASPSTFAFLTACYEIALREVLESCERLRLDAHPLADAPTIRVAKLMHFELSEVVETGQTALECLEQLEPGLRAELRDWLALLIHCVQNAGELDGSQPCGEHPLAPLYSSNPPAYDPLPRRDERFHDSFNAGVNPEAFLYDEQFSARDKTLMMYYKRIRELDVPEMMASILVDLKHEEPWEFHREMIRQLWDEARHAMMGEVGFVAQGIDWTQIPINFTWSRNLNMQLDARERHGVLFFIEQGLMPRTGKRYEWEVGSESGDPLSGLFQDFDWADEVLHAQIGRRWYVPRYQSLNAALAYGDACWSKVLSHWRTYRDEGLTEHRNWWPEIYKQACERWGKEPEPAALAFSKTYEDSRADLKQL